MPMPPYQIYCHTEGCKNPALYKIAARWSDGVVSELKTYDLCCEDCLSAGLRRSHQKYKACRLTAGEILETPGIYLLKRGQRDQGLQRMVDLEARILAESPGG